MQISVPFLNNYNKGYPKQTERIAFSVGGRNNVFFANIKNDYEKKKLDNVTFKEEWIKQE